MELYALKGYQNVSITDLQFALDIGRGTLYYYFKDQDELFTICMEKYFLEPKQHVLAGVPEDAGVAQMIEALMTYLNGLRETLMSFDVKSINTSNVNNLMFTAYIPTSGTQGTGTLAQSALQRPTSRNHPSGHRPRTSGTHVHTRQKHLR